MNMTGLHTPENQPEGERERDKKDQVDLSSDGANVL